MVSGIEERDFSFTAQLLPLHRGILETIYMRTQRIEKAWLAVRRQPHDFVFISVVRKSEILGHRLVENAERMRKIYAAVGRDVGPRRDAPSCTREITETINRHYGCLIKWADVKC